MALTVALAAVNQGSTVAGQAKAFTVTVTNTGAAAVTLTSLVIGGDIGVIVGQPVYLQPNVPVGVGNPILAAAGSATYSFACVFPSPYSAGPSPQNPGGAAPISLAPMADPFFVLQAQAQSSDGSLASGTLFVPVLSTISPFPLAQGGALQFGQGFNFINFIMLGAI